jgi:hypothetical protein
MRLPRDARKRRSTQGDTGIARRRQPRDLTMTLWSPGSSRLLLGALGGIAGTVTMTMAMRRMHRRLADDERYPLPPREIIESMARSPQGHRRTDERELQEITLGAHFAYGAATGALYHLLRPADGVASGAGYGLLVWAASYLGWIPGLAILEPATRHPLRRNGLMLIAHLVWGASLALTIRELQRAEAEAFAGRMAPDAAGAQNPPRRRDTLA